MVAAHHGKQDIVEFLVGKGADINAKSLVSESSINFTRF
jgi:hypothetical protein